MLVVVGFVFVCVRVCGKDYGYYIYCMCPSRVELDLFTKKVE